MWNTFNPTIHPIHKELSATEIPHYPPLPQSLLRTGRTISSSKKITQKGRSVNFNVAFLQAHVQALTIKTFYGREATIIILHTLVLFLILTKQ